MSLFKPPEGLSLLLPHEKAYERIYEKNTPKEITEKLLPTILHESSFFATSLYGHRLFHCSQTLDKEMHAVPEPKLPVRAVFASTEDSYIIKESLGPRTYRVHGEKVNRERVLKLEWTERPVNVPRIQGTMSVLQKIKETKELFPKCEIFKNVIAFHVAGVFQERFAYYITDSYDCNLQDMLYKTLDGRPITRHTALHVAIETLKGIHDLHMVRFMHRDIKPSNFYVGRGPYYRKIYLGGFNASYYWNYKKLNDDEGVLGKVRSVNARFQSRNYHTCDPMNPIDDIESWVYMIIYLFNPEKLPWRFVKSERRGYEYKCMLVRGAFDLGSEIKFFIRQMLNYLNLPSYQKNQEVDFGFFCSLLNLIARHWKFKIDDPLDWVYDTVSGKNIKAERQAGDQNIIHHPMSYIDDIRDDPNKPKPKPEPVSNAVKAEPGKSKASKASKAAKAPPKAPAKDSIVAKKSEGVLKPVTKKKKKEVTKEATVEEPPAVSGAAKKEPSKSAAKKAKSSTKRAKKKADATQEQTIEGGEVIPGASTAKTKAKTMKSLSRVGKKKNATKEEATKEEPTKEDAPKEDSPKEDAKKEDAKKENAKKEDAPKEDAPKEAPKDAPKEDLPKEGTSTVNVTEDQEEEGSGQNESNMG